MFQKYSKKTILKIAVFLPIWVFVGIYTAEYVLFGLLLLLDAIGLNVAGLNQAILNTILTALVYIFSLFIVVGIPYKLVKSKINKEELGLGRLPSWTDILVTPAALIVYFVLSSLLILLATQVLPWFDVNQVQDTGFNQVGQSFEVILAFVSLVVVAPLAEEVLFRGYLYGRLKGYMPIWLAVLITSLTFGFVHGAWNLAVDTFALSVILCGLREMTGSIWSSVLLHMAKNAIAFYILFINL